MMGYKRDSFLIKRSLDSFHFKVVFLPEAEGLSDMSASSVLFHGYYESNVYIFISSSGPSDAYSSTLSSLNFNLWPHLTDQMVFPKINHGFLSADQQLIKRRLIKVVPLPAGVWFLLRIQLLLRALLLCIYLSCMAHRWWVGLCQYSRRKLCLVTDSIESPPVLWGGSLFCFLIKQLQLSPALDTHFFSLLALINYTSILQQIRSPLCLILESVSICIFKLKMQPPIDWGIEPQ